MLDRLKRLFRRKPEPEIDPVALVLLETTPRRLSPGSLAGAIARAIGTSYPAEGVREENPWLHRANVEGYEFTFEARPVPYIPKDREPPEDARLAETIDRHEAAVLLDCWAAPPGREREDSTDLMGRILGELFDETSVGVYCFHTQRLNPVDNALIDLFREGRAYEAMRTATFSSVSGVAATDERMAAAIAEARSRWSEFLAAFDRRSPVAKFGVKGPFAEGDWIEHMWVEVEEADFARASGRLLSHPYNLSRPRQGDWVTVAAAEISDWSYIDGEASGGSFSEAVVREAKRIEEFYEEG